MGRAERLDQPCVRVLATSRVDVDHGDFTDARKALEVYVSTADWAVRKAEDVLLSTAKSLMPE